MNIDKAKYYNVDPRYIDELFLLQSELLKLQKYINDQRLRLAIFFEGRDTAGKGSGINRFTQFLNPESYRTVALSKPTKKEKGQWYFQRYIKRLPDPGQIVFFDRSWYNRAVVEPVMGFCDAAQYDMFMSQVITLEQMLIEDGLLLVKFWFSINSDEQQARILKRQLSPLEQWKVSTVDLAAQTKWKEYTEYKTIMFDKTSSECSPWVNVRGDNRESRRIQAIRYVLSLVDYEAKSSDVMSFDDSNIIIIK
jgi:polyphosphate kinase 2